MSTDRLTSTRIFAALSAVLFHVTWTTDAFGGGHFRQMISNGPVAVSYFFSLSGFIMAMVYDPERMDAGKYWLARFARIYPLYAIALIWHGLVLLSSWNPPLTISQWTANFLLLQSWIPGFALTGNPPGWSLSTEVAFYLAFPLFVRALKPNRLFVTTVLVGLFWIFSMGVHEWAFARWSAPYSSAVHDVLSYSPLVHFNQFLLGAVMGAWSKRLGIRTSYRYDVLALAGLGAFAFVLAFGNMAYAHGFPVESDAVGMLAPAMLVFIYALPRAKGKWAKALEWWPLVLLGEISYGVYLFQAPVLETIQTFGWLEPFHLSNSVKLLCFISSLLIVSTVAYFLIEKPARAFIRGARLSRNPIGRVAP